MLFTRCPDCGTTFRVTDEALTKAQGQVRCGRCASVFNAYAEVRDPPSAAAPAQATPSASENGAAEPQRAAPEQRSGQRDLAAPPPRSPTTPDPTTSPTPPTPTTATATAPAPTPTPMPRPTATATATATTQGESKSPEAAPVAPRTVQPAWSTTAAPRSSSAAPGEKATFGHQGTAGDRVVLTVADVVAQVGLVADEDAETGELEATDDNALAHSDAMSAEEVDNVLEVGAPPSQAAPWPLSARRRLSSRWWSVAAILATVALGAQAINHFRADLVHNGVIGPIVEKSYAMLGTRVLPRFDVHQYQILDWVATAEPSTRGQGSLKITARIQNRAQQSQPYPSVHVQLKDRWEAAVGSRVFAPNEYGAQAKELMAPGETARAEIEVVDPGPDAYGFELDVCIEVETDVISCGADKVFL